MAKSTQVKIVYDKSSTVNGIINSEILKQEIVTAGVTAPILAVNEAGTEFNIDFSELITSGNVTTIDGVVTAHEGESFDYSQSMTSNVETTGEDSGSWVQKGSTVTVGPVPFGDYTVLCSCEVQLDSSSSTTGVQARLLVNGNEVAIDTKHINMWQRVTFAYSINGVAAGTKADLALEFQRVGTSGIGVSIRRARIFMTKSDVQSS